MKVRSFQGVEVSLLPYKSLNTPFDIELFSLSGYVGYYYEKAVAPTWTVRLAAGMHTVYGAKILFVSEGNGSYSSSGQTVYDTYQSYVAGVEPKWHYSFKKRYVAGKATLNSGGYLSLPISIEMRYNEYSSMRNLYGSISPKYVKTLHVLPTWGFRSALSRHFYWEGSAGVGACMNVFNTYNYYIPNFDYSLRLSIGYAF
jgi:hypothetical protein